MFGGTERAGSSESDSEGAGGGGPGWAARRIREVDSASEIFLVSVMGFVAGAASSRPFEGGGLGAGVSSVVECLPLVQGGIERNSSKVRTRVLQHFQPAS